MRWQGKSKRKYTGGKATIIRGKRKFEIGREFSETKIGLEKKKKISTYGGNIKLRLLSQNFVNVTNKDTKKSIKVELLTVKNNDANKHYIRRNIITKGSILMTSLGEVRVTNRPGQDGLINAILIKKHE